MMLRGSTLLISVIGLMLALVSIFADFLGVGGKPGFGYNQATGLVIGLALTALGFLAPRVSVRLARVIRASTSGPSHREIQDRHDHIARPPDPAPVASIVLVAVVYAVLVAIMWAPYSLYSGLGHETAFP